MADRNAPCILVVEDDRDDVLFLERAFEQAGLARFDRVVHDGEVAAASLSGRGAFRDREAYPPRILDLKIPKITGLDVLR